MGTIITFYSLSAIIVVSAILAVTSRRIFRAAASLLFVMVGVAGLYLLLNYHFLAAVQLAIYAGGILILFIFAILLTSPKGDVTEPDDKGKVAIGLIAALGGLAVVLVVLAKHVFLYANPNPTLTGDHEINMKVIGSALMGTGKYQYLLPFEVLSVLLLAAIIGGIIIAKKR